MRKLGVFLRFTEFSDATAQAQIVVHLKYTLLTFINMMKILHANTHFRPYAILILEIVMAMIVDGMKAIASWTMLPF